MDQDLVSFVLRFVREAGEEQQARWRGVVKHVQSNTEASFSQFSEALAFMQGYVNDIAHVEEKLALDFYYLKYRTLTMDLLILWKTLKTVLLLRGI